MQCWFCRRAGACTPSGCTGASLARSLCPSTPPAAGTPQNVTYYGGIGKVTVLWESPAVDPDPSTTKYRLYATPLPTQGRRRLLDEAQTSIAALLPSKGDGSSADPFNATVYLPGESGLLGCWQTWGSGIDAQTWAAGEAGEACACVAASTACVRDTPLQSLTSFISPVPSCQHDAVLAAHHTPTTPLLPCAAGNYTFAASAWNAIGESALSPDSARTAVGFSTHPRFWTVQGSPEGALLRVIRPDSVAEPDNIRFKIGILKAGDSGEGAFRAPTEEQFVGNGSMADPATFSIPLSAFGEGVAYAQVRWRGI